jgi:hypothetical protein
MANSGRTRRCGLPTIRQTAFEKRWREMTFTSCGNAFTWIARVSGLLFVLFVSYFVIAHAVSPAGLPAPWRQPLGVQLDFVALFTMVVGCVMGWTRAGVAAVTIFCGYALWQLVERRFPWPPGFIEIPLVIGALYAASWWCVTRASKTR